MDDRVDQRLAQCALRHRRNVPAVEPPIDLPPAQAAEPPHRPVYLILQAPPAFSRAQYVGPLVGAAVRGALHEQAQGVRIRLRVPPEHHQPVQRGAKDAIELVGNAGVAQVVFVRRLRWLVGIQPLRPHEGAHGAEVDVVHGRGRHDLLLGEDETECVHQLLKLGRGRRHRRTATANPESAVVNEGLVAPLMAVHVDPVHPPEAGFVPSAPCGDRLAATGMQQAGQPFLYGFGVRLHSDDRPGGIFDAEDDEAAVAVRERAQRLSNAAQVVGPALEFGAGVFSGGDAPLDFRPFHLLHDLFAW